MLKGLPEECTEIDTFLRKEGFKCKEPESDGVQYSRRRYYTKDFRKEDSNLMLRVVIRFELLIHDDPGGSYNDNHELYYENCHLAAYDRQMATEDGLFAGERFYDEETESLRRIDKYAISISSYEEVLKLVRILS